jgi:hypothetical protein
MFIVLLNSEIDLIGIDQLMLVVRTIGEVMFGLFGGLT